MKKTKFYNIHEKLGAKLVPFAGYQMPIQYSSIIAEHKAVRNSVGVFDVSHMGEVFVSGDEAEKFVQHITVNDASKLTDGRVQYSAMCYENGGIIDDLLVYRFDKNNFMLVINASNIEKDFEWMEKNNNFNATLSNQSDDYSLLAVQGPNSKEVVQTAFNTTLDFEYYYFTKINYEGKEIIISRTGYTGELGYEIYFKGDEKFAEQIWSNIFSAGEKFGIAPIGLGARDTLRLEMGFCLYGNDIDQTTNPLEAGLGWITKLKKENFIGQKSLLKIKEEGIKRKLTPMISEERIIPRKGYEILSEGKVVGVVTSGTQSPTLEKSIALGYVETESSVEGKELFINIRGKEISAKVVSLPFVKKKE